jgi:hypothetical protein
MRKADARISDLIADCIDEFGDDDEEFVIPLPAMNNSEIQLFINFAHHYARSRLSSSDEVDGKRSEHLKFPSPIPVLPNFEDIVGRDYAALVDGMDKPALDRIAWVRLCNTKRDIVTTSMFMCKPLEELITYKVFHILQSARGAANLQHILGFTAPEDPEYSEKIIRMFKCFVP